MLKLPKQQLSMRFRQRWAQDLTVFYFLKSEDQRVARLLCAEVWYTATSAYDPLRGELGERGGRA